MISTANQYVLDYQGELARDIVQAIKEDERLIEHNKTSIGPTYTFVDASKLLLRCRKGFFLRLEAL